MFLATKGLIEMSQNSQTSLCRGRMSMAELLQAGDAISKSQMFGCSNVSQGVVIAEFCDANNLSWLEWLADFSLGGGKIQMKSEAMLRRLRGLGGDFAWKSESSDTAKAVIEITYKGKTATATFGDEQAERAGLLKKDTYKNYRAEMYRARAASIGVRMVCPEALGGFITEAECDDVPSQAGGEPTLSERLSEETGKPKRGPGRPKKEDSVQQADSQQAGTTEVSSPVAAVQEAPAATVPATAPETAAATPPAAPEAPADPRLPLIKQCGEYCKELGIDAPKWAVILEKVNCPADEAGKRTLTKADETVVRQVLAWLQKQAEKLKTANTNKSAEEWANSGMPTQQSQQQAAAV